MMRHAFKKAAGAFALLATLSLATAANAGYTYSTELIIQNGMSSLTGSSFTSMNGTTVTLQDITSPGAFLIPGTLTTNIGNVGVTTTSAMADSFSLAYTDIVTISNAGATGTFTVTGTLTLTNVQTSGGAYGGTVSNLYNAPYTLGPIVVGGETFTLNIGTGQVNDFFGPPTIGQGIGQTGSGSLGAQITSSSVPEPASMAMVGLGLAGVGAYSLRRRRSAR